MTGLLPFKERLKKACHQFQGRLGLADSDDPRALSVAQQLLSEGTAGQVALYTPQAETLALAAAHGIDLGPVRDRLVWAHPHDAPLSVADRVRLAAEHLAAGKLDAVLGGNVATTADVIRAGIKKVGLTPGIKTVSGAFIMHRPGQGTVPETTYLFADCGVVIAPTSEQLVDIAAAAVSTWRELQPHVPPVVAFLSFSTKGSAHHPAQAQVAEAAARFQTLRPDVVSDGELQFDAAIVPDIARRKAPGSAVAGLANCFIFPDLNAGNIGYKMAQRLGGFEAFGPILQGLRKPLNDLSRGATVNDMMASAYISLNRAANLR